MTMPALLRARVLCLALCVASSAYAERPIEPFDQSTWSSLQKGLPRPAAVIFTATYCSTCPQVLGQLAAVLRDKHVDAPLIAVVIDGAESEALDLEHYALAQRIFVFDGEEAPLRYAVDPNWRGETPFIALLPRRGSPHYMRGLPSKKQLENWLQK
jgi:hypothetical protein